LKILRKNFLKLHTYKLLRKRSKLNFINFFEQSENELRQHKKFSLFFSKYKRRNLSWFSDFHDYTFFQRYYVLKRDKFWYSIARRESLRKHHDGRNIFTDAWNNNFLLQQQTMFFYKKNLIFFFLNRNNNNNFSSLLFLQYIINSILKKYFFFMYLFKNLIFLFYFSLFFYLNFIQFNYLICLIFFFVFLPIFFYYSFIFIVKKYRFSKISILLNLRKSYIYNVNLFFFFRFFKYFVNFLLSCIFISKKKINFFFIGFFGNFYLKKIIYNKNKKQNNWLLFLFVILNLKLFIFFFFFIYNVFFYYDLFFYNFFNNIFFNIIFFLSFFLTLKFLKLFKFIFLLYLYNDKNYNQNLLIDILNVNFYIINLFFEKFLCIIVKFYFNNDYKNFYKFLNIFFHQKPYFLLNIQLNDLLEQFVLLKNLKNIQYLSTFYKLKKNAI
jgi:hypothetical protein